MVWPGELGGGVQWRGEEGLLASSSAMLGAKGDGEKSVNIRIKYILQITCRNGEQRGQGKMRCSSLNGVTGGPIGNTKDYHFSCVIIHFQTPGASFL